MLLTAPASALRAGLSTAPATQPQTAPTPATSLEGVCTVMVWLWLATAHRGIPKNKRKSSVGTGAWRWICVVGTFTGHRLMVWNLLASSS